MDFRHPNNHIIAGLDPAIQGQPALCKPPLDARLKACPGLDPGAGHDASLLDAESC